MPVRRVPSRIMVAGLAAALPPQVTPAGDSPPSLPGVPLAFADPLVRAATAYPPAFSPAPPSGGGGPAGRLPAGCPAGQRGRAASRIPHAAGELDRAGDRPAAIARNGQPAGLLRRCSAAMVGVLGRRPRPAWLLAFKGLPDGGPRGVPATRAA